MGDWTVPVPRAVTVAVKDKASGLSPLALSGAVRFMAVQSAQDLVYGRHGTHTQEGSLNRPRAGGEVGAGQPVLALVLGERGPPV